eukprot:825009_1
MSVKDFHTTSTWMHLSIAFSILYAIVVFILLVIESKSFYQTFYGWKEPTTSSNRSKEANNTNCRLERAQSGSDEAAVESQGTATSIDIDMSKTSQSSTSSKPNRSLTISRLRFLPLLMYTFYIMTGTLSIALKLRTESCSDYKLCGVGGTSFVLAKLMMYLIFIYRLHAIYSNTVFSYNTKYLSMMAVICVLYSLAFGVVFFVTLSPESVQIGGDTYCECDYDSMLVPSVFALADIIVCVICSCAFIKPLKALQALTPESRDEELHRAVVKTMTLTSVAVISTIFIMFVVIVSKFTGLASFDVIINSICIFLMDKERALWFRYLCFDGKCGAKAVECCCANETKQ